ncbi:uncharacterized protein TNCV_5095701 [Trichonephila clavipes]|nr:uncharacterized protein TNCV_5095701 [Trichonephila clavipes]
MYIQDRFGSYRSIEWTKTDWNCTRYSIITCFAQTSDSLARLTQTLARMPDVMDMRERNIKRILEIKLINSFPPKIIWRYGIYPKLFDKMSDIEFHEGMPFDVEDITNAFVIMDDLMNEVGDDKRTFKLVHERKPS